MPSLVIDDFVEVCERAKWLEMPVGVDLVLSSAERGARGRATTPLELRILVWPIAQNLSL